MVAGGGVSSTAELDRVVEEVCALSPLVDDLVSELPAPIYGAQLVEMVCSWCSCNTGLYSGSSE